MIKDEEKPMKLVSKTNLETDIDDEICKECENMLLKGPGSVF